LIGGVQQFKQECTEVCWARLKTGYWVGKWYAKKNIQPPYVLPRINSSPDIPLREAE